MEADWPEREAKLQRAQEAVFELREKLLAEGIHPVLLVHAFFFMGLCPCAVKLDDESQLMVCDTLNEFINDTKAIQAKWKN